MAVENRLVMFGVIKAIPSKGHRRSVLFERERILPLPVARRVESLTLYGASEFVDETRIFDDSGALLEERVFGAGRER